ncbi:MAG: class I SAM-dependent RNA methyltransferase [Acidobacteria bacterium]|nr:MAG: class I SAM-dependent RNA methyltransferase [Acidobacteriota bacterium]REK11654.1 MAG: class I SAM-dependent RNA methyltransferase [Acidobacteriota bacterium]
MRSGDQDRPGEPAERRGTSGADRRERRSLADARPAIESAGTVDVEVERLVQGGVGLAFWKRFPLLVEGAAPQEKVRVEVVESRPDYARVRVVEVLRAGADRVAAPCVYYAECGGCDLQHIRRERQLPLKAQAALETLHRIGKLRDLPEPRLVSGQSSAYRSRAQLHTERQEPEAPPSVESPATPTEPADATGSRPPKVGFRTRGGHEVVDVEHCLVLDETLQQALGEVRSAVRRRWEEVQRSHREGDTRQSVPQRIDLLAGDGGRWVAAPLLPALPRGDVEISYRVGGRDYRLACDAHCFFQSNRGLAASLVEAALESIGPSTAPGDRDGDRDAGADGGLQLAWDLYAGVGLFTLPLSDRVRHVVAVEGDRAALRHLRRNVRRRAGRVEAVGRDVESFLRQAVGAVRRGEQQQPQLVVLDPPRSGVSKGAMRSLLHLTPPQLRYVSCDPATLARDLARLDRDYRVERLVFVDLFPHTSHLECVAALRRREGGGEGGSDGAGADG